MKQLKNILAIFCVAAIIALSACKECKDCFEYQGTDDSKGRPEYYKIGNEYCNDELDDKQRLVVPNSDTTATVAQFKCE